MAPPRDRDLIQMISLSRTIQDLLKKLLDHVDLKSITVDGYIYIDCTNQRGEVLKEVRDEFKKDSEKSKKVKDAVEAMIPQPKSNYSISSAQLLGLQGGPVELEDLGGQDICVTLIPVVIEGNGKATLEDPETERRIDVTLKARSGIIINGRCALSIADQGKVICAMLYIGKDRVNDK